MKLRHVTQLKKTVKAISRSTSYHAVYKFLAFSANLSSNCTTTPTTKIKAKNLRTNQSLVKGEGHSKEVPFLFRPVASKHSDFPLTEVSASEVFANLKKFVLKNRFRRPPF